ncbi:MAG: NUDIX hydrolase [Myxococcota bacterium]
MELTDGRIRIEPVTLAGRGGQSRRRLLVRHPGAVVILPILSDGRLVFVKNRRFAIDEVLLELPAGTLEGESPEETAARELQEETGYRAASLRALGSFYSAPGFCDERMHAFVARDLHAGAQSLDPTEEIEVALHTPGEVDTLIQKGAIIDGKTLAALLLWKLDR